MTETNWRATRALFDACIDEPTESRRVFLSQASDDVRKEVTDLLAVADRESSSRERYRATAVLDTGGSGLVFRAHDEVTHEEVILKMFRIRAARHGEAPRCLKQHLALRDSSLALTEWLDGSIDSNRIGWIITKPFHSKPLLRWIESETPELSARIRVFETIAATLEAATGHGLPAVWPKPNQVLVDHEGLLQLTDLGFIKLFAVCPHQVVAAQVDAMHGLANILFEGIDTSTARDPLAVISQVKDLDL